MLARRTPISAPLASLRVIIILIIAVAVFHGPDAVSPMLTSLALCLVLLGADRMPGDSQ